MKHTVLFFIITLIGVSFSIAPVIYAAPDFNGCLHRDSDQDAIRKGAFRHEGLEQA